MCLKWPITSFCSGIFLLSINGVCANGMALSHRGFLEVNHILFPNLLVPLNFAVTLSVRHSQPTIRYGTA